MKNTAELVEELRHIIRRLRAPDGCPWDRKQTPQHVKGYLVEELYELLEAIDLQDPGALAEETGDVLFLLLFLVNLYEEQGLFSLDDALALSARKMIHRHPHVFGSAAVSSAEEVMHNWQELKVQEGKSARKSYLDGIARGLPALVRADHLTARAARVGFDWDSPEKVIEKVKEEIHELEQALGQGDRNAAAAEFGDMLFSMVNLARHLGIDPEQALRRTNDTFCRRFAAVESGLTEQGKTLQSATLAEMDALWDAEKKRERGAENAS